MRLARATTSAAVLLLAGLGLAAAQTPAAWQASGTVILLRGGNGSVFADNVAVPLVLDEYLSSPQGGWPAGTLVRSQAVRTATSGNDLACVASFYTAMPDESYPANTADGSAMIFPCNAWAVGVAVPVTGGNAGRIIGVVLPNGTVDTRTRAASWTTSGNQRGYFRTVGSASLAQGIYVGGTQGACAVAGGGGGGGRPSTRSHRQP
jgi:hypothetical protein